MDEDTQAPPSSTRPGHQEAKTALVEMQKQSRQEMGIVFIPRSERKRLNDQLDPELQPRSSYKDPCSLMRRVPGRQQSASKVCRKDWCA